MGFINNTAVEQKCKYCGTPYVWYERHLSFKDEPLRVLVPNCNCIEKKEKEAERRKYLSNKALKLEKLFSNSLMTPFFKEKKFENLNLTEEVLKCKNYAKTFNPKKSKGIRMIGNIGTGKTTLLAAICNELMQKNYSCLFTTFSDLLDKFSSYAYENSGNIKPLLDWLITFDFIVIDDLGRETYTDKRKEFAFRIIDTILNNRVVMCFTANPEMLAKIDKIPEWKATFDRLKEICPIQFTFKGESMRGVNVQLKL